MCGNKILWSHSTHLTPSVAVLCGFSILPMLEKRKAKLLALLLAQLLSGATTGLPRFKAHMIMSCFSVCVCVCQGLVNTISEWWCRHCCEVTIHHQHYSVCD